MCIRDRFEIATKPGMDARRDVFQLAVKRGWPLLSMHNTEISLEDVFLRLTSRPYTPPEEESTILADEKEAN